jgi:xanthine dehydrogenase accessory factor
MLTANEVSEALKRSLDEGRALVIVSAVELDGQTPAQIARLLVEEGGAPLGGTLGDQALDTVATRQALALIADERQEMVAVRLSDLLVSLDGQVEAGNIRERLGEARLLFEIARPPLELIICGGGHVGRAVAKAGRLLDFNVTVIDDRAEFASRERLPDPKIHLVAADFVAALQSLKLTPASHLVIVTRGHKHDEICLQEVVNSRARYIGMIGSRRRTTTIREHLRQAGVTAEALRRVHAPIGLDIGAQTPEEIALAILAEIVLVRRGGSGQPKSLEGPMARAR